MYNGIGLQTARGTGTNGYVQRNLSYVRVNKEKVEYKPDEEIKKLEAYINKKGNAELLQHDRKRKIELKCVEMEEMMSEQGYSEEEIARKVEKFRKQLIEKDKQKDEEGASSASIEYDEYGRPKTNESHKLAEANDMKNKKLREAFGLGEFEPTILAKKYEEERRIRDEQAKQLLEKRYKWVDEDKLEDIDDDKEYERIIQSRKVSSQVVIVNKPEDVVAPSIQPSIEKSISTIKSKDDDKKKSEKIKTLTSLAVTNAFAEPVCSNLIGGCTEKKQFVKEPYDCDNCITVINFIANLAGLDGYEVGIVQTVDLLKVY